MYLCEFAWHVCVWGPEEAITLHFIYGGRWLNPDLIITAHLLVGVVCTSLSPHPSGPTGLLSLWTEAPTAPLQVCPRWTISSAPVYILVCPSGLSHCLFPKWRIQLFLVSELSKVTGDRFTRLDIELTLKTKFCTRRKGVPLYLIKLFDHAIAASHIPKNFSLTREGMVQIV